MQLRNENLSNFQKFRIFHDFGSLSLIIDFFLDLSIFERTQIASECYFVRSHKQIIAALALRKVTYEFSRWMFV